MSWSYDRLENGGTLVEQSSIASSVDQHHCHDGGNPSSSMIGCHDLGCLLCGVAIQTDIQHFETDITGMLLTIPATIGAPHPEQPVELRPPKQVLS